MDKKAQRKIFGTNRAPVTGNWQTLLNKELT
jgi:hypothetical protein